jgi:hypothetical protein
LNLFFQLLYLIILGDYGCVTIRDHLFFLLDELVQLTDFLIKSLKLAFKNLNLTLMSRTHFFKFNLRPLLLFFAGTIYGLLKAFLPVLNKSCLLGLGLGFKLILHVELFFQKFVILLVTLLNMIGKLLSMLTLELVHNVVIFTEVFDLFLKLFASLLKTLFCIKQLQSHLAYLLLVVSFDCCLPIFYLPFEFFELLLSLFSLLSVAVFKLFDLSLNIRRLLLLF